MRALPDAFAAHLAGGVTTLCRCWSLRRRDGVALGFTDHDRDLTFSGLTHAARTGLEAAEASQESGFAVSGGDVAGGFDDGLFTAGRLAWTSGANAGLSADVRLQLGGLIELWEAPARRVAAGDAFALTAGCDKRLATCRDRFGNAANFQGFPHMPGNDAVLRSVPGSEPVLDGSSYFR